MKFPPFLLNDWLIRYHYMKPPIEYDLAASTGPLWTLRQLTELSDPGERAQLLNTLLDYTHAAGTDALRKAIAEMQDVERDEVQVLTGAAEALFILFVLAAEDGANVLVPFPGFPPFTEIPKGLGIEVRSYHLRPENLFRIDLDEVRDLTDVNTKLLIVNTPHNPTGATLSNDELQFLNDFAADRNIQLVVDQVYHPIYQDREACTATRFSHATVVGDFSKALCLPALRVGWIVDRNPVRMKRYHDARSYFTVSNTSVGEALAVVAARHREKIYAQVRRVTRANVALLDQFFEGHADVLAWVRPKGGMTAFPWLKSNDSSHEFCEAAAKHGVLLAPGDCFGAPAHFRLGFGASGDRFAAGLERLGSFVRHFYSHKTAKAK